MGVGKRITKKKSIISKKKYNFCVGDIAEIIDFKTPGSYYNCKILLIKHINNIDYDIDSTARIRIIGTPKQSVFVNLDHLQPQRGSEIKHYDVGENVHVQTIANNDDVSAWWDATVVKVLNNGLKYKVRWREDALDKDKKRYYITGLNKMRKA